MTRRGHPRGERVARALHAGQVDEHELRSRRAVATPRIARRVVCGRSETIATFSPTIALTSVDLPTLGRPASATKPLRASSASPRAAARAAARASRRRRSRGPCRAGAASRARPPRAGRRCARGRSRCRRARAAPRRPAARRRRSGTRARRSARRAAVARVELGDPLLRRRTRPRRARRSRRRSRAPARTAAATSLGGGAPARARAEELDLDHRAQALRIARRWLGAWRASSGAAPRWECSS